MRKDYPLFLDPGIEISDVAFIAFDDTEGDFEGLPQWFRNWTDSGLVVNNITQLYSLYDTPELMTFTMRLFDQATVVGALRSKKRTRREANTTWLVLRNDKRSAIQIDLTRLRTYTAREFFFLCEPFLGASVDSIHMNLVNRFFLTFGGLRDSPPFWGGDYFAKCPSEIDDRMITSRDVFQPEWLGSQKIYTRGNCDYLILNARGTVGYVPIESDRMIEVYSNSFEDAILKWLSQDQLGEV